MKNLIRYLLTLLKMMLWKFTWFNTLNPDEVLFMSFDGKQYSDSPKVLSEYLHETHLEKKLIWAFNGKIEDLPSYVDVVDRNSKEFRKSICTAGTVITNNSISSYIPIRKNQIFLNTWHGGSPTKTVGYREANPDPYYKYHFKIQDNKTTAILSGSSFFSEEVVRESFGLKKTQILELGFPKNDILLNDHTGITKKVKDYYQIGEEIGIILYAPTFRGLANDSSFLPEDTMINPEDSVNWFESKFQKKFVFLFRAHHTMKLRNMGNCINATDYPDMQELLCALDFLITDYSSCMHDCSLMKKPVFLYIPDYEDYMNGRGFYYDIPTMPFPYALNLEEFNKSIFEFDYNKYIHEVEDYHNRMGNFESGHATADVVSWLENKWKLI